MRFRTAILTLLIVVSAGSSRAVVLHGTLTLFPWYMPGCECGWDQAIDFSANSIVSKNSGAANLAFHFTPQNGTPYWSPDHFVTFYYLPNSTIESLESVPATGTADGEIHPTGTYVMKTSENFWVKFTVRGSDGDNVHIEYYLQFDGTRYFGPLVAVEPSTWGKVKALYR